MKTQNSFKEIKKHGNSDYPFDKYEITSDYARQFAVNHWHDETEIIHVEKGCISITINNQNYTGNAGDIFIVNNGELHEIYGTSTPLEYSAFVFDFDMLSFRNDDIVQQNFIKPVLNKKMQFLNRVQPSETACALLHYIKEINNTKPECYTLSTKATLLQFFALMIQENQILSALNSSSNNQRNQILKNIVSYIDENYDKEISLAEISSHFNMSHKYFCRFFKNNFKKTFIEYLNDVRIENSIHLPNENNLSVTDTAISCGFSNMSYFTRTFKKKVGCTPSEYKKLNN